MLEEIKNNMTLNKDNITTTRGTIEDIGDFIRSINAINGTFEQSLVQRKWKKKKKISLYTTLYSYISDLVFLVLMLITIMTTVLVRASLSSISDYIKYVHRYFVNNISSNFT